MPITNGTYTIGTSGDYASLGDFNADLATDIGDGTITAIVTSSHDIFNNIYFAAKTSAIGSITITGDSDWGDVRGYQITGNLGGGGEFIEFNGYGNYKMTNLRFENINSIRIVAGSTRSTEVARCVLVTRSNTALGGICKGIFLTNNGAATNFVTKVYDCIIINNHNLSNQIAFEIQLQGNNLTTAVWDRDIRIENITIIREVNSGYGVHMMRSNGSLTNQIYSFYNIAVLMTAPGRGYVNISPSTLRLCNCACHHWYNLGTEEINHVPDLDATDFLSIDPGHLDLAKIGASSRLFETGTDVSSYNTLDFGGTPWSDVPSIGAFSGLEEQYTRPLFTPVDLASEVSLINVVELEFAESLRSFDNYLGGTYYKAYNFDDLNLPDGNMVRIFKKINSFECDGQVLTRLTSVNNVYDTPGSWYQDWDLGLLYLHPPDGNDPNTHLNLANFSFYISDRGIVVDIKKED